MREQSEAPRAVRSDELEAWDSSLRDRLAEVSVAAPLSGELAGAVIPLVRRAGFAVVDSEPAAPTEEAVRVRSEELHRFGAALGTPVVQSPRNELVEDVKDFSDQETSDDRGYRSAGELAPHSDPPTLILLHCLRPARRGGESSLVNVAAIVDQMTADAPALVEELFAPLPSWRVAGQYGIADAGPSDTPRPVLARHGATLSCVLYRPYIEQAAETAGPALTEDQVDALNLFEKYSMSEALTLRFALRAGQTLVLHNRAVLHARTDYVDWPERSQRRHLLRMWIDAPAQFPVHPVHELGDFFAPRRVG